MANNGRVRWILPSLNEQVASLLGYNSLDCRQLLFPQGQTGSTRTPHCLGRLVQPSQLSGSPSRSRANFPHAGDHRKIARRSMIGRHTLGRGWMVVSEPDPPDSGIVVNDPLPVGRR